MKIKKWILVGLVAGLVGGSHIESANAYFTTYVTAKGGYEVSWKHQETIEEEFQNWRKYVKITNKEGSIPVFVRAKAFAGIGYSLEYTGNDWDFNEKDGYYYYQKPLAGGETTEPLVVSIGNIPENAKEGQNFNVVVVYESIPAQYGMDGNLLAPMLLDWSQVLTSISESYNADTSSEQSEEGVQNE